MNRGAKNQKPLKAYSEVLETSNQYQNIALSTQCYLRLIHLYSEAKDYKDGFVIIKEYLDFTDKLPSFKDQTKIAILENQIRRRKETERRSRK
jgi:hypothetical protein